MFASITISAKAAKRLVAGYPWVFDRDILSRRFDRAGIVGVLDTHGKYLGQAFYSPGSKIALRFITRSKEKLGKEFWRKRVLDAFRRRSLLPLQVSDAYRVAYAESDYLPSIIIDKYNDIFALQVTSAGAETIKQDLIDIIVEEFKPASVIEKDSIEKVVYGDKTTTIVHEGSQKFEVDVLRGQKTGAYLDYRGFRLKAAELLQNCVSLRGAQSATKQSHEYNLLHGIASPLDKLGARNDKPSALDLFCYQGWFACQIASNCRKVTAVDSSADAINAARRNSELNGHKNIEFAKADAFGFLAECNKKFDFIHLDPPPFAKGHENLQSALKGYKKLLLGAMKHLNPKGILLVSSCSHHISEGLLEKIVREACQVSGFKFHVIYRGIQDKDHPVLKGFPESLYLKAVAIQLE